MAMAHNNAALSQNARFPPQIPVARLADSHEGVLRVSLHIEEPVSRMCGDLRAQLN